MRKIKGGYLLLGLAEIVNLCAFYRKGLIKAASIRVYLSCRAMVHARSFSAIKFYRKAEIASCTGLSEGRVGECLEELIRLGLLSFSETAIDFNLRLRGGAFEIASQLGTKATRLVPLPRRILRQLMRHPKPQELIAALAHLIRLLFRKKGRITGEGSVSATWVAKVFSVSERTVQGARRWLIEIGAIEAIPVPQWYLNRFGARFRVLLEFAPPNKNTIRKVHTNQNNKEPVKHGHSGVFEKTIGSPTLTDIKPEDLRTMSRLEVLYRQAVARKWLPDCEASIKNFVGAATRAVQVEGNPVKIFVGIVKKGLWCNITQAQEDISLRNLNHYRAKNPVVFTKSSSQVTPAFIPEVVTPRTRPEEIRPERVVIRKGQPQSPQLKTSQLAPVSEIVSNLLSRLSPRTSSVSIQGCN